MFSKRKEKRYDLCSQHARCSLTNIRRIMVDGKMDSVTEAQVEKSQTDS